MKTIKMGLLALAAITGIGGAFASSHKKPVGGTKYYAVISGSGSVWSATPPAGHCTQTSKLACTITSTSANVTSLPADTFPAQYTVVNNPGKARS